MSGERNIRKPEQPEKRLNEKLGDDRVLEIIVTVFVIAVLLLIFIKVEFL